MIKLLTENAPFPSFSDGVFSLRQRAFFDSYGVGVPFFMTWIQTDKNGETTAVITSLSGDVTLSLSGKSDFEEIREFLFAVGFSSVFFNNDYSSLLSFENCQTGKIMELKKRLPKSEISFDEPDYRGVYNLIFEKEDVPFSDWFTDMSLRVRRKTALIHVFKDGDKTVSSVICQFVDEKSALIGSVYTKEEYRNKGIATKTVTELCAFLQQMNLSVFLCRENNKNKDFYSRIGFIDCGEWASVKNE
jgi:ribosomal protein S18 acetylase RimI-like enzyme